jgi:hypothetical protein
VVECDGYLGPYLAAKLGIAIALTLRQNCRLHLPRPVMTFVCAFEVCYITELFFVHPEGKQVGSFADADRTQVHDGAIR